MMEGQGGMLTFYTSYNQTKNMMEGREEMLERSSHYMSTFCMMEGQGGTLTIRNQNNPNRHIEEELAGILAMDNHGNSAQ
jgi:hypothetical protein